MELEAVLVELSCDTGEIGVIWEIGVDGGLECILGGFICEYSCELMGYEPSIQSLTFRDDPCSCCGILGSQSTSPS